MFLVCQVIKQDHVINDSGDFNNTSLPRYVTTLPSLVVIDTAIVEI